MVQASGRGDLALSDDLHEFVRRVREQRETHPKILLEKNQRCPVAWRNTPEIAPDGTVRLVETSGIRALGHLEDGPLPPPVEWS